MSVASVVRIPLSFRGASSGEDGALVHEGVKVWRVALDPHEPPDPVALAELSSEERDRGARYATDALRNRWLHGKVALRRLLAAEAGVTPSEIAYGLHEHGKPFLASPRDAGVEFSYSDSEDVALIAVSRIGPVGVDVEHVARAESALRIALSRFAPSEREAIVLAPEAARGELALRIWTRKEAYLKAIGAGLTHGLGTFEVSLRDGETNLLGGDGDPRSTVAWRFHDVTDGADNAGVVVFAERSLPTRH